MRFPYAISDVQAIQANVLREYLTRLLDARYQDGNWRKPLKDLLTRKAKERPNQYAPALAAIREDALENYNLDKMDTSILVTLLIHDCNKDGLDCFFPTRYKDLRGSLERIQSDRNWSSHLGKYPSAIDMLAWAASSLNELLSFVSLISQDEYGCGRGMENFCTQAKIEILQTKNSFESAYTETVREQLLRKEIEGDIAKIRNSDHPDRKYAYLLSNKYAFVAGSDLAAWEKRYFLFNLAAANAGIEPACLAVGEAYFEGNLAVEADYELCCHFYSKAPNLIGQQQKLQMAAIFLAEMCPGHTEDEGQKLLDECKEHARNRSRKNPANPNARFYEIVAYKLDSGMTAFRETSTLQNPRLWKEQQPSSK